MKIGQEVGVILPNMRPSDSGQYHDGTYKLRRGRVVSFDSETVVVWAENTYLFWLPIADVFVDNDAAHAELEKRNKQV